MNELEYLQDDPLEIPKACAFLYSQGHREGRSIIQPRVTNGEVVIHSTTHQTLVHPYNLL